MPPAHDHHVHSLYSGHSDPGMTLEAILRRAAKRGLRRLVVLEHVPRGAEVRALGHAPLPQAETDHLRTLRGEIDALRGETPVRILLGAELDADPHARDGSLVDADLEGVQIVLASCHLLPGGGGRPGELEGLGEEVIERYYAMWREWIRRVAANPVVDVLAHPGREMVELGAISSFTGPVLEDFAVLLGLCRRHRVAFELNELHLERMNDRQRETFADVIALARDGGVPLSLGSDAHEPGKVGLYRHVETIVRRLGLGPEHYYHPPLLRRGAGEGEG